MNIFLIGMPEIHTALMAQIITIPGILVENNFQQVLAMTYHKELKKLCIFMDAWNCSENYNGIRGQTAAENIHKINPSIPVLIWDGREYLSDDNDISPVFKIIGTPKPIIYKNELYLSLDDYSDKIYEITKLFFENKLSSDDIPYRECLEN